MTFRLPGLIAATYTPMLEDGQLNLAVIPAMVDHLLNRGVDGLYVCGSTGEGVSLSSDERKRVAASYVQAVGGRLPVVVQVGHNSVVEASELAAHAAQIGADAISATCPSYFPVDTTVRLIDCMQQVAAGAPHLPFYYYHIPILTGSKIRMPEFLASASQVIPNLVGLKYTAPLLHEFQECLELNERQFDVVWGTDEMLLGALATGAQGAIGSTYNVLTPLYRHLMEAFHEGDWDAARKHQSDAWRVIRTLAKYPFHAAMKSLLSWQGVPCGPCRTPQSGLDRSQVDSLRNELEALEPGLAKLILN